MLCQTSNFIKTIPHNNNREDKKKSPKNIFIENRNQRTVAGPPILRPQTALVASCTSLLIQLLLCAEMVFSLRKRVRFCFYLKGNRGLGPELCCQNPGSKPLEDRWGEESVSLEMEREWFVDQRTEYTWLEGLDNELLQKVCSL